MSKQHTVAQYKKDAVAEYVKLLKENPVVAVANIENLPSKQFAGLRAGLRDKITIKVGKRRLFKLALEELKKDDPAYAELEPYLDGIMPALLFSKDNPFILASLIAKNKSTAPAKAGQNAPNDIKVKPGPTPFAPGPVIGQLGALGIKTAITDGKIHISEEALVVKEGDEISADAAGILSRLGVEPMEIGLNLLAAYEGGEILTKDVLFVDTDEYFQNFTSAHRWAFNLAFNTGFPTSETTPLLVTKAASEARTLAIELAIPNKDTIGALLARAAGEAGALQAKTGS